MNGALCRTTFETLLTVRLFETPGRLPCCSCAAPLPALRRRIPALRPAQLDALAAKASNSVVVDLDEQLLQVGAKFLGTDRGRRKIKAIINGLKGVYVKVLEFDTEGQYTDADLRKPEIATAQPGLEQDRHTCAARRKAASRVYVMHNGTQVSGLALLAADPKEITVRQYRRSGGPRKAN